MTQRGRDKGNKYASLGVVQECEETACDEQLVIHLEQHMEGQFADWLERFEEQIRAVRSICRHGRPKWSLPS